MSASPEQEARAICHRLRQQGHRALFAGGCVRDQLLGTTPKDFDIATSARPNQVVKIFPNSTTVGAQFGVVCVPTQNEYIEVATFRKDGPYTDGRHPAIIEFVDEEEDARRRDFTINALFLDPKNNEIIDYVGGQKDLTACSLRAVGEPQKRLEEDHLRVLRAIRFAARLDFVIENETYSAITKLAPTITKTSVERIYDELILILTEGGARRGFELLSDTGLLEHILPEINALKGVEQPPEFHPEGDVFVHTLLMLDKLPNNVSPPLALATLLHDIGKPLTQTFEDRIRFNNHHKVGARMTEKIADRLRMSNQQSERITWLVEQHMRLATIPEMRESKRKRFVREDGFPELLELCRLDCLASHGKLDTIEWIEQYCANLQPEQIRPKPLLNGNDLIKMGYRPSPLFAEILTNLEDAQLEASITEKEDAKTFVTQRWPLQNT